jgi:hypothetical protein
MSAARNCSSFAAIHDGFREQGSALARGYFTERMTASRIPLPFNFWRMDMRKSLFVAAVIGVIAAPAFADEVGVRVGPVGAGVSVGEVHDRDRDRDRDRTTVIKEREPRDSTTVIKKEDANGDRSKTVIHHDN